MTDSLRADVLQDPRVRAPRDTYGAGRGGAPPRTRAALDRDHEPRPPPAWWVGPFTPEPDLTPRRILPVQKLDPVTASLRVRSPTSRSSGDRSPLHS